MANTFKVITRDVAPASAGSPETRYTVKSPVNVPSVACNDDVDGWSTVATVLNK